MLDRYRLVSNSDAHSPGKLGREATTFDCALDYFALRKALETGQGFVGTVEFFPEEGKYHLDGHRKCGVKFSPRETLAQGGRCPVCGGAMTVGVLSRVETLADRSEAEAAPPATAGAVSNLVALPEMLGEIASSGPSSKTVERGYSRLLSALGPELDILQAIPLEDISRADSSVLAEAVARLRAGKVIRDAGYDGEYGVIRLFEPDELRRRTAGGMLFESPPAVPVPVVRESAQAKYHPSKPPQDLPTPTPNPSPQGGGETQAAQGGGDTHAAPASGVLSSLDSDQRAAASVVEGPLAQLPLGRRYRRRFLAGHRRACGRADRGDRARAHHHPRGAKRAGRGRVRRHHDRAGDRRLKLLRDRQQPHRWAGSGALLRRFRRPLPHRRAGRRSVRSARAFRDSVPQAFACPAGAGAIGRRPARSVCGDGRGRIDLATRLRQSAARAAAETGEAAAVERALELLLPLVERCGGDPARFLDAVGLASDADFWDERAEGVALLTLHAAKGLEFACVFIVGLEDGVLPLHWGRAEEVAAEELAEERRLFYDGMTRAKDRLVLSHALKRLWRGRVHAQAPSPFLADIESELVKEQRSKLRRGREDRQLKLL